MLLTEPESTPYDLRFRLFGVDVRVNPFFWLMAVVLGFRYTELRILSDNGMVELAIWVLAVFLSILLHEFGHVWMGQAFGSHGHILLHSMGGLAIGSSDLRARWQRILVMAAGPGIQLILYGALFAGWTNGVFKEQAPALKFLVFILLSINLYWPILNLLPVYPLDGGQITREVATAVSPRRGVVVSLWISLIFSATVALNALVAVMNKTDHGFISLPPPYSGWIPTNWLAALMFALFAAGSWQALQIERSRRPYEFDESLPWER